MSLQQIKWILRILVDHSSLADWWVDDSVWSMGIMKIFRNVENVQNVRNVPPTQKKKKKKKNQKTGEEFEKDFGFHFQE